MNKELNNLLKTIKFVPIFVILLTCIFIITLIYEEKEKEFKDEKIFIKNNFIDYEKEIIETNINILYSYILNQKEKSKELLKKEIKTRINTAHKIATNIYLKNKEHKSKKEILQQIKDSLEAFTFNEGRGYFSIYTTEGTSILERRDIKINYPIQEASSIVNLKDEEYFTWQVYKSDNKSRQLKNIGIAKRFEPYNLTIITSEDVDAFKKDMQKEFLQNISKLRYKNDSFIFIVNYQGKILVQNKEKLSYLSSFFKKISLKKNKEIDSFSTYELKLPNKNETKIFYTKKLEDWEWIIGTGFQVSDVNKRIENKKNILNKKHEQYKKDLLIYGLIFTCLLLIILYFLAKLIEKRFLNYRLKQVDQVQKELVAKEKVIHLEELFNSFFQLSINLQLITTTRGKIIQINKITETILGYKNKDLINKSFIDLIHPDDLSKTIEEVKKLKKGINIYSFENRYKHKNGKYIDLIWFATTNKLNNLIYATAQDITEKKLKEIEKEEIEKLFYQQSKIAAMGEMLGNIAHQWRQPLSVISTAATGIKIQKEMNILNVEGLNDTMTVINDSAQYLSKTIEDFRSFFDQSNTQESKFLISLTISKTLKLINSELEINNIEIIENIKDITLISFENELIQVLMNILNNAKDALIKIENQKRLIFIDTYIKDTMLIIEIKDNAKGIDKNIINRIFEPYFTTKHQSRGTGIGLYMSEEIIKNHLNGNIKVENETYNFKGILYTGAKFTITIPIN